MLSRQHRHCALFADPRRGSDVGLMTDPFCMIQGSAASLCPAGALLKVTSPSGIFAILNVLSTEWYYSRRLNGHRGA